MVTRGGRVPHRARAWSSRRRRGAHCHPPGEVLSSNPFLPAVAIVQNKRGQLPPLPPLPPPAPSTRTTHLSIWNAHVRTAAQRIREGDRPHLCLLSNVGTTDSEHYTKDSVQNRRLTAVFVPRGFDLPSSLISATICQKQLMLTMRS
jgi:hypothetical protein